MAKTKLYRRMRGLDDKTLSGALTNHAGVLNGLSVVVTRLLHERRVGLVWAVAVTVAVVWLAVTR